MLNVYLTCCSKCLPHCLFTVYRPLKPRYDSDRVPAFPLEQEKRALHLLKHPEQDLTGYPSYCLKERCLLASLSPSHSQLPVTISKSSTATTTMREFSSEVFQGEVDTLRARTHSHYHYYARVISNKRYKVTRLSSSGGSYSGSSLSSKSSQSSSLSGRASAFQRKLSSVSLKVEVSCHSVVTAEPWYYPYAELGPVLQPSKVRPVAPDGEYVCVWYVGMGAGMWVCRLDSKV